MVKEYREGPNPLAQTFSVPQSEYPQGMFASSCDIYFYSKDAFVPVTLDIRQVVGGILTKNIVPLSRVVLVPDRVQTSVLGTVATKFTFDSPVYLVPGDYAITLFANSDKYRVFIGEVGGFDVSSAAEITKQPFGGVLIKSQNTGMPSTEIFKDLKFTLNRCKFTVGSGTVDFTSNTQSTLVNFTGYRTVTSAILPDDSTTITYQLKTRSATSNTVGIFTDALVDQNQVLESVRQINASVAGDMTMRATLATTDERVSPILDSSRFGITTFYNSINNTTSGETTGRGGSALARYITRRVNLAEGFEADSLKLYLSVNKPAGTDIKLYYKVLASGDSQQFDDRPYVEIARVNPDLSFTTTAAYDFIEDEYFAEGIAYTGANGGRFKTFKTFAIKVVLLSTNRAVVPRIKDLRVVALS